MSQIYQIKITDQSEDLQNIIAYNINHQPIEFLGYIVKLKDETYEAFYAPQSIEKHWNQQDPEIIKYQQGFFSHLSALTYILTQHSSAEDSKAKVLQIIKNS